MQKKKNSSVQVKRISRSMSQPAIRISPLKDQSQTMRPSHQVTRFSQQKSQPDMADSSFNKISLSDQNQMLHPSVHVSQKRPPWKTQNTARQVPERRKNINMLSKVKYFQLIDIYFQCNSENIYLDPQIYESVKHDPDTFIEHRIGVYG